MNELKLVIAGNPPTMNHVYRNISIRKRVTTYEGGVWKRGVQLLAKNEIQKQKWQMTQNEKIVAEVLVYWPTKRRRDVENIGKLLWDSLEGIVYDNDAWLLPRYMDFHHDKVNPRVEIIFYRLGSGAA